MFMLHFSAFYGSHAEPVKPRDPMHPTICHHMPPGVVVRVRPKLKVSDPLGIENYSFLWKYIG